MHVEALPSGLKRFGLQSIAPELWRNGGGLTRQIASGRVEHAVDDEEWDWRVSVADITSPGSFSTFPGVDRYAALANGRGFGLKNQELLLMFAERGDQHAFAGETQIDSVLQHGPVQLFNLMVVRQRGRAAIHVHRVDGPVPISASGHHVLLVAHGAFRIGLAILGRRLVADLLVHHGEGFCLHGIGGQLTIESLAPASCLLHAEVGIA